MQTSNKRWLFLIQAGLALFVYHFLFHLSFVVVMEALKGKQSTGCPLESLRVFARSWLNLSTLLRKAPRTAGGPSSSCEMIILRNKSHGEILLEFVWEYLRPFRNKKNSVKFSIKIPHLTSTVHRLLSDHLLC